VLRLKERLGLFEDPYRRGARPESDETLAQRRALARTVAERAVVMLKNARGTLPWKQPPRRVAVLGPLADAPAEMRGPWWSAGEARAHVSVLAGVQAALPGAEVLHAPGVAIEGGGAEGIAEALELCGRAEAIVLCIGESAIMSGEAASRADLALPGRQRELAEAVCARAASQGKPTVAVLFCGRPLVVPWLIEKADAVLAAWFLGCEAGNAIAALLTGRVSPSGRTAITWPRALGQVPIFFGERPSGRPMSPTDHFTSKYLDVPNDPQFPFGYGLTYGRFVLSNLRVTPRQVHEADTLEVRVDVANTGEHPAQETVFLFTHDKVASVARPLLELKGFGKATLAPGEKTTLALQLPARELRFLGVDLAPLYEPGEVEVLVGPCADRAQLLLQTIELV
jgi:beta-glucosidase